MWFWIFMLTMNLLIPLSMLLFGLRFLHKPPKEVNSLYGYRTAMSMKNKDTWLFAHKCCGRLWVKCGWILLFATIAGMLAFLHQDTDTVSIAGGVIAGIQVIVLIGSIFPVERALKKQFDKDGKRTNRNTSESCADIESP